MSEQGNEIRKDRYYVQAKQDEARNITNDIRLHKQDLQRGYFSIDNPLDYYNSMKDQSRFRGYKEPSRRQSDKRAGINYRLKWLSKFSSEKKKELEEKRKKANEYYNEFRKEYIKKYDAEYTEFEKNKQNQHMEIDKKYREFKKGNNTEIEEYFWFILNEDYYYLNFDDMYTYNKYISNIRYDNNQLIYYYRIPNSVEFRPCTEFEYDENEDKIKKKILSEKEKTSFKKDIVKRMILRTIRSVFYSDRKFRFVDSIKVIGFLNYLDDSYGRYKRKNVFVVDVKRSDIIGEEGITVNDDFNVSSFFERLKVREANGLYSKTEKDIKEIEV